MSKFTDFLNLFMWDSIEDSEEEFNIDKALNDNWKKIDTKVKTHVTSVNEEINNFKEETNQKIENIQALPVGGTKGQVLTKQSETNGDANWEDIEANEVFVGNEEEAPETAKIIVEEDDFVEGSTLSKAEVYVGAEEPTTGEKVWFRKGKNYLDISKLKSRTTYGITFEPTATGIKITGTAQDVYAYGGSVSVELKKGKTYMLYGNNAGNTFKLELRKGSTIITTIKTSGDKVTFTPSDNINIVTFVLEGISKGTTYNYEINNLQIEQGSKNTSYEAYIEPKLSVRNSNGVYEEFAKKSEEVYSTEEQIIGTWIDGKPLYRKVISSTLPKVTTETVAVTKKIAIDADIKTGFIEKAFYYDNKDNQIVPIPFILAGGQVIKAYMGLNGSVMLSSNTTYTNEQLVTIIVCYTKTTD